MKELIQQLFNIEVKNIRIIGEGLDSVAYVVNDDYIFKKSKHVKAKQDMKKEVMVLKYLEGKLPLKIPIIEYYDESNSICGYKMIDGDILTPNIYKKMSDAEQNVLALDIANFLKKLHSLDLPIIDDLEIDVVLDYQNDYEILKKRIYDKISLGAREYIDRLFNRILNDERIIKCDKVLCHNDLSCNHMIMKDHKLVGIIDFGDVAITDKDREFVYLLEDSSEELGHEFGLKVINYYGYVDKDTVLLKADLNEEYYPLEQIIWGLENNDSELYNNGLNAIKNK